MQNRGLTLTPPKALYYFLFTVSGFSGLIYESIWSHYLKLFLGHAAYAQSLVLSIFMGGMAAGAWLAGHYSPRWRTPILAYAAAEALIGIFALIFHNSFVAITDTAYSSILPATDSVALAHTLKWSIAALMIVPQSILLGMTFPLMTSGVIRRYPADSGATISVLYFTNSIGAAAGVLASGFWLIGAVGLPGTIMTAGMTNVLLALAVWVLVRLDSSPVTAPLPGAATATADRTNKLLLTAAFVTGMASFIYEIGWIRMLSLVLGSSTHAFELMLSAFITGLAFGGLWIRKRIDAIPSPVRFAGYVQVAMGLLALLTLPLYSLTFDWMSTLMKALGRTEEGYTLLLLASHGIVLFIMLPATFCAGMTLPLFTHALMKAGYGEKSIGQVYAFNTAGSIAGVVFAVHLGMPLLGLRNLIGCGALLDIALGIGLLAFAGAARRLPRKQLLATAAAASLACICIFSLASFSREQLASGVFRYMRTHIGKDQQVYFYRDGKTASVAVNGHRDSRLNLTTNGKPDASISYAADGAHSGDETTMVLLSALPYSFNPEARTVANIGLGSGLSTHTMLALPQIERVDTIEIEPAIVEASREFGFKVERAHNDPRSRIHIEDAKTFFAVRNRQYDIIVSEPSNPWVSGVSSLFTEEFYRQVVQYLHSDGVFSQWLHLYESNWMIVASILRAMDGVFSDYVIYEANDVDIVIIAAKNGRLQPQATARLFGSELKPTLAALDIHTPSDLHYRFLASKHLLGDFLQSTAIPVNSDYFPYLDQHAHKAFFLNEITYEFKLNNAPLPVLELLDPQDFHNTRNLSPSGDFTLSHSGQLAAEVLQSLLSNKISDSLPLEIRKNLAMLLLGSCGQERHAALWLDSWRELVQWVIANLDRQSAGTLWNAPAVQSCLRVAAPELRLWIEFHRAVAMRNAAGMARYAGELLLQQPATADLNLKSYLLAAAMLGNHAGGNSAAAAALWEQYSKIFYATQNAPFYLQIVAAHIKARADAN